MSSDQRSIFWWSNPPFVGSGYGTQTALFAPLIAEKLGYRVAFGCNFGLRGSRLQWQSPAGKSYMMYPGGRDIGGNDVIPAHTKHWGADLVIKLDDPWVTIAAVAAKVPMLAWTPVDHDPLIPLTHDWLRDGGAIPLAMSRFGEEVMRAAGHDPLYAPHGFDPSVFRPMNRAEARRVLGIPESAFVVGVVAANKGYPSRKSFFQILKSFTIFQQKHEDAVLYLHTTLEGPESENLPAMCDHLGVRPLSTDPYSFAIGTPAKVVAALMNAFDVLLNPSRGEGFGVPLVESEACGTPCIVSDFSSMPEVAPAPLNWLVEGEEVWTSFESAQVTPSVEGIVAALEEAYAEPTADRLGRRAAVAEFALGAYEANMIVEQYWKPVLEEALARIAWGQKRLIKHEPRL